MTRVLIVDDHRSIRSGLRLLFDRTEDLEVCGTAPSGESGLALALSLHPDVVLMDLSMPGMGGVEATRAITRANPGVRVIVLSWQDATETRREVVRAGAAAFVLKGEGADSLMESVRAVARGEVRPDRDTGP